jgi:hypothetical protein
MRNFLAALSVLMLCAVSGCATLNKTECVNADWRIIGMEDGTNGRLQSYIGRHRSACAKFNIVPDLDAYQQGYSEGIGRYCTESNGFESGKRGAVYNGVCPSNLESLFLDGYDYGRRFYTERQKIKHLSSAIRSQKKKVENMKEDILEKEKLLISVRPSPAERIVLLAQIKEMYENVGNLEADIDDKENQRWIASEEIERLNRDNPYY